MKNLMRVLVLAMLASVVSGCAMVPRHMNDGQIYDEAIAFGRSWDGKPLAEFVEAHPSAQVEHGNIHTTAYHIKGGWIYWNNNVRKSIARRIDYEVGYRTVHFRIDRLGIMHYEHVE